MDKPAKSQLGKSGEEYAANYLISLGFKILHRNVRERFGELDIVARDADGVLVLVEVKTMNPGDLFPEDQMSKAKISKLKRMAEFFANSHPELITEKNGWRIDVLCLTKKEKDYVIKLYANIT